MKKLLASLSLGLLLAPLAGAQMSGYLDDFIARVKPDKRAEFDAVCKKIAEANRKAKGDSFIAFEQTYGEDNVVMFVSTRENYGAIDQASAAFMSAVNEAYGPGGMKKMMMDFAPTVTSARARLRIRRPELSLNAPADADAYNKMVGNARYLRTLQIRIKPGHAPQFEQGLKEVETAFQKATSPWTMLVSQSVAGEPGGTYYISTLQPNMAGFDSAPNLRKLMGDEEFVAWQKASGENTEFTQTSIYRILPELSNPPKEVAAVAPDFWHPKVVSMAKPKAKTEPAKVGTN